MLKYKILLELANRKPEFVDLSCSVRSMARLLQVYTLSVEKLVVVNVRKKLLQQTSFFSLVLKKLGAVPVCKILFINLITPICPCIALMFRNQYLSLPADDSCTGSY